MGLESALYVSELVATNPLPSDQRKQGDDHLRLIKEVLQATFPNASVPHYRPEYVSKSSNYTVQDTDQFRYISVNTSGGAVIITLLDSLTADDAGFYVYVGKGTADVNEVTVAPATGTINTETSLNLNTYRDTYLCVWSGSAWFALRVQKDLGYRSNTSATVTAAEDDFDTLIDCNRTGTQTVDLPNAATKYRGRIMWIRKGESSTGNVTIDGAGAETINGATTLVLTRTGACVALLCTGTTWIIVAQHLVGATLGQQLLMLLPLTHLFNPVTDGATFAQMELATDDVNVRVFEFYTAGNTNVQAVVQMPKSWNLGDVVVQVVWAHNAATAFDVRWTVESLCRGNNNTLDTSFVNTVGIIDTGGTADRVYISDEATLPISGASSEGLLLLRVTRTPGNVNDTLDATAKLIAVKVHYTTIADTED